MANNLILYTISSFSLFSLRAFTFLISLFFMYTDLTTILFWEIFSIFNTFIVFPIILDPKGLLFSSVVLFISANVINFAKTYISDNIFTSRFIILVLLFVSSINILIYFPHLITLLLGWDGLGLTRFLLVIFYQNSNSLGAGIITALTNRIGDTTLLLAIGWTLNNNQWSIINIWNNRFNSFIVVCILIAAITKSAQIPFSSWLPAAIAAPTPVSALVHSSTLVTAGVFLLIRFFNLITTLPVFLPTILFISCLTILIAGLRALAECDLKKIIALSTLRQLGVIIRRLGLNSPNLAFFHLITHALFKALLFICAGSIIHFHAHGQDLRTIGNLTPQIPFTISCLLIANISLCGLPFLSGFYSKDAILELSMFNSTNWIILIMLLLATICTIIYSFRLIFRRIWSPTTSFPAHFINNSDLNILYPALCLTLGAISGGSLILWVIAPITTESYLPFFIKILPFFATLIRAQLTFQSITIYSSTLSVFFKFLKLHRANSTIWFLTPLSRQGLIPLFLKFSHSAQKTLDQGWNEALTAQGVHNILSLMATNSLHPQNNHIITLTALSSSLLLSIFLLATFLWEGSL